VPILKELNPNFISSFQNTQNYLQQAQGMVNDAANMVYEQVAQEHADTIHFDLKKLKQLPNYSSYLFQWLKEYGFTAWEDIYDLVDGQTGKKVYSEAYFILKNRSFLILSPISKNDEFEQFTIEESRVDVNFPIKLSFLKKMLF